MGKVIRETYQAIYKHGVKHPSKPLSKLLIGYNDFVLLKMYVPAAQVVRGLMREYIAKHKTEMQNRLINDHSSVDN